MTMEDDEVGNVLAELVNQVVEDCGQDMVSGQRVCGLCQKPCNNSFTCKNCPVNKGIDKKLDVCDKECQTKLWKNHKKEHKRKRDREQKRKKRASRTDKEIRVENAKKRKYMRSKRASRTDTEIQADNIKKRKYMQLKRAMRTNNLICC